MQVNIPTLLTILRLILIPFFFLASYLPFSWSSLLCTAFFCLASLTDWFDGFLARRLKQSTHFGAFLDPVADKVTVTIALVLIMQHYHVWWVSLPAGTMITREIAISALREWMAKIGKFGITTVSWAGKLKTAVQMLALTGMLWRPNFLVEYIGILLLFIAAMLTAWSMLQYFFSAFRSFVE